MKRYGYMSGIHAKSASQYDGTTIMKLLKADTDGAKEYSFERYCPFNHYVITFS